MLGRSTYAPLLLGCFLMLIYAPCSTAEDLVRSPLETGLSFHPSLPHDNQPVYAMLGHYVGTCGWWFPELLGVTRTGQKVRIDIASAAGFEGGLGVTPVTDRGPTKCSPAGYFLAPQQVDLGQLDAGTYEVTVYLTQTDGYPEPITVPTNRETLTITEAPDTVPLQAGRFEVAVDWSDADGVTGVGRPVPGPTADSTLFSFFERSNWELMIKVLDACALNGHYWVFTAAATDVAYDIAITDQTTGARWTDSNLLGVRAPAVADTSAFPCGEASPPPQDVTKVERSVEADEDIVPSPLGTEVAVVPFEPTENDNIVLLLAHSLNNCGWTEPTIEVTRDGQDLTVHLAAFSGFGGGLAVDRAAKCSPAFPYLAAQRHDLGQLDPGTYNVSIILTENDTDPPKSILTHRFALEVASAPREVGLQDDRFVVSIDFADANGISERARPVPEPTSDSTLFTFYEPTNWEAMVKVLDGCAINGHFWILAAAATDVGYEIQIRDQITGNVWHIPNLLGNRPPAFANSFAFPCTATDP